MKATELRIGNLIRFNNLIQPEKIIEVDGRFLSSFAKRDDIVSNYYQPITLTEEWLLKFGFEGETLTGHYFSYKIGYFKLWYDTQNVLFLADNVKMIKLFILAMKIY